MAHLSEELRAARQVGGLAAARPWEAVLEVRLAAAGRAVERLWARQGEGRAAEVLEEAGRGLCRLGLAEEVLAVARL